MFIAGRSRFVILTSGAAVFKYFHNEIVFTYSVRPTSQEAENNLYLSNLIMLPVELQWAPPTPPHPLLAPVWLRALALLPGLI